MAETADQKDDNPKFPTITRAELAGGYFNKHVAFVVKTPAGTEIKRRYTDFEWLRGLLIILYPGAFIPPIPPKLPIAMWPQGYLLMRKRELQQFLQRLEVIPYLKQEEVTTFFLTNHGGGFEKARKKWEKQHPRPSDKALYEKLVATFPKIHETETPDDMDKRCQQSTELIDESIKQLEIMVKASEAFIDITKECCDAMTELKTSFDDLIRIEDEGAVTTKYCAAKRIDIAPHIEQWRAYKLDEISNVNTYYSPTLNRALNDLKVIREILKSRDQIQADYADAKKRADVWNDPSNTKAVRTSDLPKKHREIQREEDLRNLKGLVEKLVLGQLNVVFCANARRWKKSCNLFASKHLVALEKVLGSWKALTNKILQTKGDTDAMFKAVTVETLDDDEEEEEKQAPKQKLAAEPKKEAEYASVDLDEDSKDKDKETVKEQEKEKGNDEDAAVEEVEKASERIDDVADTEQTEETQESKKDETDEQDVEENANENEENNVETETETGGKSKEQEEEEEAARKAKEEEEEEKRKQEEEAQRKAKEEEEERIRKEKEEQLRKEKEATQEKMKEMFKDDTENADNEFPWDD
mmetsp:Transcript_11870/g.19110  ORF Transcript_11870/g.19110 Transcript_11870/m.19110 type:complete len:584 (+) Transcript_11870:16-1767(+)